MPRIFLTKFWLIILLIVLGAAPGWGQGGSSQGAHLPAQVSAAAVCPCTFGPLITDTAIPIEPGKFDIQPLGALRFTGGSFTSSWRRVSAGGNFISFEMPVKITYGLMKNMEVYVVPLYRHNWASNVDESEPTGERNANHGGLGDLNLTVKYQVIQETDTNPAVTGLFRVDFPLGHYYQLNPGRLGVDALGSGSYAFTLGANLSKWIKPVIVYSNLWYAVYTSAKQKVEQEDLGTSVQHLHPRDKLFFRLAVEYPLGQGPWVALFEFYSEFETGRIFGPRTNADTPPSALMGILPGLEYIYREHLAFAAGVAIDVAGKNADFQYTPMLSVIYTF